MMFSHTIQENGRTAVIKATCPIDTRSAGDLKTLVDYLMSSRVNSLVIDGSSVDYISSEGLFTLYSVSRKVRSAGGGLAIAQPRKEIKNLIELLKLSHELIITDSVQSACRILEESKSESSITQTEEVPVMSVSSADQKLPANFSADEGETIFDQPIVVECEECKAFVRVHSSGRFMCPSCHAEFTAEKDGTVIF
jgi:anti-anti-sigma factor